MKRHLVTCEHPAQKKRKGGKRKTKSNLPRNPKMDAEWPRKRERREEHPHEDSQL